MKLIVDTGPLVALLDRRDPLHAWAQETFEELAPPYLTCDAVLTEASHFLGDSTALRAAWLAGELVVEFDSRKHRERICALMERYQPMDFADACIVVMAELHHSASIITIDRKDFSRYRIHGRNALRTVMP
ncbi:MAG: type II toxin-antitoxin system VapC family toxin [Myxococcota bacterium]